jgi:hypothetical protein
MSQHVHKIPPQRVPLYMAAMLNMSDAVEDHPPPFGAIFIINFI